MVGGHPKGNKNKKGHNAGGVRKGENWESKKKRKASKELSCWNKRLKENRNKLLNFEKQKVKHPLCSETVEQS